MCFFCIVPRAKLHTPLHNIIDMEIINVDIFLVGDDV